MPAVVLFDGLRDYDIVLIAESETVPADAWRFSVLGEDMIDIIIEKTEQSEDRPGLGPLRLELLLPFPDSQGDHFVVLPPEELWPVPTPVPWNSLPPPASGPSIAPDLSAVPSGVQGAIQTLLAGDAAEIARTSGDLPARESSCVPIPDNLGACSSQLRRAPNSAWTERLASSERSVYAVLNGSPIWVVIAADTGGPVADAWRFSFRGDTLVEVEFNVAVERAGLPVEVTSSPTYFWGQVRSYTPDPGFNYDEFLVLPPADLLPEAPRVHNFDVRTGGGGVDAIIALLQSGDAAGLASLMVPSDGLLVRECRAQEVGWNHEELEAWTRDTLERAYGLQSVVLPPPGYHESAEHVIVVTTAETPLLWRETAIMERDGDIVGLVAGLNCYQGVAPGERTYLIPPIDTHLGAFDSSRNSGVEIIDRILEGLRNPDSVDWDALVDWQKVTCGMFDYGPGCPPGAEPGTLVEALQGSACHGEYTRRDQFTSPASLGPTNELYAVVAPPTGDPAGPPGVDAPAIVATIITANPESGGATAIALSEDGMAGRASGCGSYHPEWFTPQGEPDYLLPPP